MSADALSRKLDQLQKLAERATDGPWYVVGPPWNDNGAPYVVAGDPDPHVATFICDLDAPDDNHSVEEWERVEADAAFIAAFDPPTVAALCEAVKALERVDAARDEIERERLHYRSLAGDRYDQEAVYFRVKAVGMSAALDILEEARAGDALARLADRLGAEAGRR